MEQMWAEVVRLDGKSSNLISCVLNGVCVQCLYGGSGRIMALGMPVSKGTLQM